LTTSTAVKFEIGDRVELVEDYGSFNTGAQGTVERVTGGYSDNIVKVKMDHKNDNGRDSINAFAYRLKKAADFKKGDRVAFNQDYDGYKTGDTGTVILAEDPGTVLRGLHVTMDKDKSEIFAFVERWDKIPETKFKVGDRVQNAKGQFSYKKHKGQELVVVKVLSQARSYDYAVSVVGSTRPADSGDYFEAELEAYVAPQPATFNVGDYAEVHGRLDSWDGAIVRIDTLPAGEFSFYKVNVVSGGQNDYTGSAHFLPRQLKAAEKPWEPKFKKGDWVEVTNNSAWAGIGQIVREASYSGDSLSVEMHADNGNYGAGKRGGFSESDVIPASKPIPKSQHVKADFKVGQKVKALSYGGDVNNEHSGKTGEVVEIDMYIRVKLGTGRNPLFKPEELEILEESTVKFQHKLGDYVEVVGHNYSNGKKGWVVEPNSHWEGDDYIHITTEKGGKSQYRFPAENLKAAEEPKPFAIGDRVEQRGYGGGSMDGIIGVVKGFEPADWDDNTLWVQIDATESNEGKFRRFPAENLKKAPKPEPKTEPKLWTEEAKIGQAVYTKLSNGKIDRVAHKTGENEWEVTYPALNTGNKATSVTYGNKDVHIIADDDYVLV